MKEPTIKVRPFREFVKNASGVVEVAGRIEADQFRISVAGGSWKLDGALARDESGSFALLVHSEDELSLTEGLMLRVRHEYELDMPPGGEISVFFGSREADDSDAPVHMLRIEERPGVVVYFDSDGQVNGTGWIGGEVPR